MAHRRLDSGTRYHRQHRRSNLFPARARPLRVHFHMQRCTCISHGLDPRGTFHGFCTEHCGKDHAGMQTHCVQLGTCICRLSGRIRGFLQDSPCIGRDDSRRSSCKQSLQLGTPRAATAAPSAATSSSAAYRALEIYLLHAALPLYGSRTVRRGGYSVL